MNPAAMSGGNITRTIYRRIDGQVRRVVSCSAEQWAQQLAADEACLEGDYGHCSHVDPDTHAPVPRAPVPLPPPLPEHVGVRAESYPRIGDQLDVIWRVIGALREGQPLPAEAGAMLEQIAQVKRDWPKRQAGGSGVVPPGE